MALTSALIFGSIFWRMGHSQTSIQDRMGLLQVLAGLLSLLSYPVLESLCRVFGGILPVSFSKHLSSAMMHDLDLQIWSEI